MTLKEFGDVFAILAVQLNKTDVDAVKIRAYFEAMKDLEIEFVQMAAQRMARSGGSDDAENRHWFPKTSEWRAMAAKIEVERADELRARLRKLPTPLCLDCADTGMRAMRSEPTRYGRCECQAIRRLEILGRRPMPALPEATGDPSQESRALTLAAKHVRGMA